MLRLYNFSWGLIVEKYFVIPGLVRDLFVIAVLKNLLALRQE
jgi:hypothetical protein